MRAFASIFLSAGLSGSLLYAEEPPDFSKEMVEIFATYCSANPGRPDKTEALVRLEGLRELEPDMLAAFGPQDPASQYGGWYVVNSDNRKVLLATTRSEIAGKPIATCTIFGSKARSDTVLRELSTWISLPTPSADDVTFGNRLRLWEADVMMESVQLILSNPSDVTIPGVSLGIVASQREL